MDMAGVVSAIAASVSAFAALFAVRVAANSASAARAARAADRAEILRVKRPQIRMALEVVRGDLMQMETRLANKLAFTSASELIGGQSIEAQLEHVERLIGFEVDLHRLGTEAIKVMGAVECARPYRNLLRGLRGVCDPAGSETFQKIAMRVRNLKQAVETALEALDIDQDDVSPTTKA